MISKALSLIISQLNQFIPPLAGANEVVLGNIALNEAPDQNDIRNKVVLSLVNIEEESTLKNTPFQQKGPGAVKYLYPTVYLNLYVLFTANYPQDYDTALIRLSSVVKFFQSRKSFDINSAQPLPGRLDFQNPEDVDLYITLDLYSMTFEQVNHLWGSLGGKQMPFVMYKVRLVKLQDHKVFKERPLIEEIHTNAKPQPEPH